MHCCYDGSGQWAQLSVLMERCSNSEVVLYTKFHVHSEASTHCPLFVNLYYTYGVLYYVFNISIMYIYTHCPMERLKYTAHQVEGKREGRREGRKNCSSLNCLEPVDDGGVSDQLCQIITKL